jgi:hypothetical protein
MLERWAYVRISDQLIRVLRIRDFSSVPDGHALLERIQFASSWLDVSLHVEVVAGVKAQRVAARAVHRMGSDDVATQAAGFRRTARSSRTLSDFDNERRSSSKERRSFASRFSSWCARHRSTTLERDVALVTRLGRSKRGCVEPGSGTPGIVVLRPVAGRSGVVSRQWTHWATSKDLVGLKLPAHDAGTGLAGRAIGDAQRGSSFVFDPFDAYAAGSREQSQHDRRRIHWRGQEHRREDGARSRPRTWSPRGRHRPEGGV